MKHDFDIGNKNWILETYDVVSKLELCFQSRFYGSNIQIMFQTYNLGFQKLFLKIIFHSLFPTNGTVICSLETLSIRNIESRLETK